MTGVRTPRVAILMLACRDYEALEVSLACHTAYGEPDVPLFVLQNCRGGYDEERALGVGRRYEMLFPRIVRVITRAPAPAYRAIAAALAQELSDFDLVCKVDDDTFPIARGWLTKLLACWRASEARWGEALAYVTPLVNNNTWGFPQVLDVMGLRAEYQATVAREHRIGAGTEIAPYEIAPAEIVVTGTNGTIWGYAHIARWLHERTTLQPEKFIAATSGLAPVEIPNQDRYSINCILFRRRSWDEIDDGGDDDEHMWRSHCAAKAKRIVCDRSTPFVHLSYFSQREENRDIVARARELYASRLGHPFPLALRASRTLEIEARLRWLEAKDAASRAPFSQEAKSSGRGESQALGIADAAAVIEEFAALYQPATGGWLIPAAWQGATRFDKSLSGQWRAQFARTPNYAPVELEVGRFYRSFVELIRAARVLHIGTNVGFSALCIGAGLEALGRGEILTIDLHAHNHLFQATTAEPFIRYLCAEWSDASLEDAATGEPAAYDLIVLDSADRYAQVVGQINRFAPTLRNGGHLLIRNSLYFDGVGLAVKALAKTGDYEVATMPTPRRHGRGSRCPGVTLARKIRATAGESIVVDPAHLDAGDCLAGRSDADPAILDM